jgi:hypothetical protein
VPFCSSFAGVNIAHVGGDGGSSGAQGETVFILGQQHQN